MIRFLPRIFMNKLKCWNSIELRNIFLENVNEIIFVNLSSKEKRFLYIIRLFASLKKRKIDWFSLD